MIFSTSLFLLYFLPIFLLAYLITPTKQKNTVALVSSLFFYAWGAPVFIWLLLGSIIIDFYFTRQFNSNPKAKTFLILSLVLNIGMLVYFKYANFFIENTNALLISMGFQKVSWVNIALPIGISFFTFQKISYSVDVYRKKSPPLKSIFDYSLYILLFPQLIAGPIVRYNEIAVQIVNRKKNETYELKLQGFYRFIIGLSKKVIIANSIGEIADATFATNYEMSFLANWVGVVAYTIQIYYDFSGYSDMAIGLGKMIGFNFPENFNSPYIAKSITEFWQRWHITLGTWMRDYIYIPLGGNKVSRFRILFNLWLVFIISGIWHGASWNFVIWGALHGVFISLDKLFLKKILDKLGVISIAFNFLIIVLTFVIFRSNTLHHSIEYYKVLFSFSDYSLNLNLNNKSIIIGLIGIILAFIPMFSVGKKLHDFIFLKNNYSFRQHILFSLISVILLIICVGYINEQTFNPFIYFRF